MTVWQSDCTSAARARAACASGITSRWPRSDTTRVPTAVPVPEMAPDIINIVVLGSDRRPNWEDWHTDVVQVVSIQPSVPAVTVLSIPRDLYLYIPGFWMRRMHDGTDGICFKYLTKILRAYDKSFARAHLR